MKTPIDISKKYFSKLLLFGEYTILLGSDALVIPLPKYFGKWNYLSTSDKSQILKAQQKLPAFFNYLKQESSNHQQLFKVHFDKLEENFAKGLFFDSNIPIGYGIGSSGALCAAFFDTFCYTQSPPNQLALSTLKKIFSILESFFHGSSSGIDPLICYTNRPILMKGKGQLNVTSIQKENPRGSGAIFLLDTKVSRRTSPLVDNFLKQCEQKVFREKCLNNLIPLNHSAIEAFQEGNWDDLFFTFDKIGRFQFDYFKAMIPNNFQELWKESLDSNIFKLKICGAGGGGFILGMSQNWEATQKKLNQYPIFPVYSFEVV